MIGHNQIRNAFYVSIFHTSAVIIDEVSGHWLSQISQNMFGVFIFMFLVSFLFFSFLCVKMTEEILELTDKIEEEKESKKSHSL